MGKKAAVVLTVILLVVGAALGLAARSQEVDERIQLAQDRDQIAALKKEQSELEQQLNDKKSDTSKTVSSDQLGILLCFTAADSDFMSTVYPTMSDAGYTGLIALRNNIIPGDSGTITAGELQGLMMEGWNCVVGPGYMVDFDNDEETVIGYFQNYMKEYVSNLREWAKITPTAVYFDENTYQPFLDESIEEMGFDTVYYEGDEVQSDNDNLTLIRVANYRDGAEQAQNTAGGQTLGLRVTVDWVDNTPKAARYHKHVFADFLQDLKKAEQSGVIQMLGSDPTSKKSSSGKTKSSSGMSRKEIKARLAEIEKELNELYQ